MASLMTSTTTCSSTFELAQHIAEASGQKPAQGSLLQLLKNTVDEDPKKALAAIRHKSSNPFPKNLRRALGRCLVEKPYCQHGYRMSSLRAFEEPPEHISKGTPGKAQPSIRPRPPWLTELSIERQPEYGIDTIHLTPYTVLDLSIKVLKSSVPTAVGGLAFHLLQRVEKKGLLRGYSAVALVGGCLRFASYVLQSPLHYSTERLASTGLKISPHTTRSAYNALWWDRDVLEKVVKKQGATLEGLRLPVAQNGDVLIRMVNADVKRRDRAKRQGDGRKKTLEKILSSVQGTFEQLALDGGN